MEKVDMEGSESADSKIPFIKESRGSSVISKRKRTVAVFFFLTLSLAVSLMSILLSVFNHMHASPQNNETPDFSKMCLPCEELKYQPADFEKNQIDSYYKEITTKGRVTCCARNSEELKQLIDSFVTKKMRKIGVVGCPPNVKFENGKDCKPIPRNNYTIAAHVVLENMQGKLKSYHTLTNAERNGDNPSLTPIEGWVFDRSPSFIEKVTLRDNRLVVPEAGLYYLYSQVSMVEYHDMLASSDSDNTLIQHVIRRWNIFYPEVDTLLRHSQTKVRNFDHSYTEYVSYVGGVISLKAGDELFVSASDINHIQADRTQTYFGLYKV